MQKKKRPAVVIECDQAVPCNPCEIACTRGAIIIGSPITNPPQVDLSLCTGCGLCLASCPGLAIFLVEEEFGPQEVAISFVYEFLPLPEIGQEIEATDRRGRVVTTGRVIRVRNPASFDLSPVVTIAVPREHMNVVRGMKRL